MYGVKTLTLNDSGRYSTISNKGHLLALQECENVVTASSHLQE